MNTKIYDQDGSLLKNYIERTEKKIVGLKSLFRRILTKNNYLLYEILVLKIEKGIFKNIFQQPHFSWWWYNLHLSIRSKNKERVNSWFEYSTWFLNDSTITNTYILKSYNGRIVLNEKIYFVEDKYICTEMLSKYKSVDLPILNFGLRLGLSQDPWLTMLIDRINEKQPIDPYPFDLVEIFEFSNQYARYIDTSLELIMKSAPELLEYITNYVKMITLIKCNYISNFTDKSMNGVIFLGESVSPFSDPFFTAEHIIHEAAHIKLNYILAEEKIIIAPDDYLVNSPFRKDKRPLEGLLHAVYVYDKILKFWNSLLHKNFGEKQMVKKRQLEVKELLEKGLVELNRHRHYFSGKGNILLNSLENYLLGVDL